LLKSSAESIDKVAKSNSINKKATLSSKNELRNKKQTKKNAKEKQKQDETIIARTILKAKRQKILDKEKNKHNLIK